jgi:hypothetical protein
MQDVPITYYSTAPSLSDFRNTHLAGNAPALFGPSLTSSWSCRAEWGLGRQSSTRQSYSSPNLDLLEERYGHVSVPVDEEEVEEEEETEESTAISSLPANRTTTAKRSQHLLRDVIARWRRNSGLTAYVKDWHLVWQTEQASSSDDKGKKEAGFYSTPALFADDWLNSFYRAKMGDDFRFVVRRVRFITRKVNLINRGRSVKYIGPKGTRTALHRDVCGCLYCNYSRNIY